jgi:hypothetical protein
MLSLLFVFSLYDLKWVRKCWSARSMIGRTSADPLRTCVKVADCCETSSAGTLTYVKTIETSIESGLPPYLNDLQ